MKKVAFIAPTYPVLSETFVQTEVEAIESCGHSVCVLTFTIEKSETDFDYPVIKIGDDVPLTKLASISPLGLFRALTFIAQQTSLPKRSLFGYGLKLALQLADMNVQHVHAHFCQHTAAHAIVAAKLLNISCSFVAHGHDVYESAFDVEQKILACDFVVAVCQDMASNFKATTNEKVNRNIKLLHCGVHTHQLPFGNKPIRAPLHFIFLGRLVEQKGINYLLEALSPIAQPLNIHLDIVGSGRLESELRWQVKQLGLQRNVHFLGAKTHEWVKTHLSHYDCLVAPFCVSQTGNVDTGPLVLKEAMAVGTPVITTDIMGCKEIVTDETGFLVNEKDSVDLGLRIEQFAQLSRKDRESIGLRARKRVLKHFDAFKQAQQLSFWIENPNSSNELI
ncbi:glycosyltransferase [Vibrio makurazakiensis]|uniref:glycosyltransferase n=1 Tax=Vibrio makurazakiensis TaxID=2910250 RepID=UPI003D1133A3